MGSKRSYDCEEHMQLPYKYQKQFATDEKLISYADEKLAPGVPCNESSDKHNAPAGHVNAKELLVVDLLEVKSVHDIQNVVDKGCVGGFRSPWIMNYRDDDHTNWHKDFYRSLSPEYFDSSFPGRACVLAGNPLSSFLDRYPRKQVPVGVNHQAELPDRVSPKSGSRSGISSNSYQFIINDEEEKFMGTCIIPMPNSSLPALTVLPVVGRKDCDCVDRDSVRCVRQHVKEAREKLVDALGEDKFRELGIVDMGEEVARQWSQEEEQVFHEVVFSNPASLGKDFWSCLSEEFPTRSMRDLVSYYFNVFMLRKRAAQNRSRVLDIDSDDDEWHPGHGRSCGIHVVGEDDDSLVLHDEDSSDEDDDSDDENNNGGEGTSGGYWEKTLKPVPNIEFPHKNSNVIPGNLDDSCLSFEFQSGINRSIPSETGIATEVIGAKSEKYLSSDQTDLSQGCLDYSNFRQWDQGFSAGPDYLLPTQNMIEEIFGPGSWDRKPNHD